MAALAMRVANRHFEFPRVAIARSPDLDHPGTHARRRARIIVRTISWFFAPSRRIARRTTVPDTIAHRF